jgi:hypothetical protein
VNTCHCAVENPCVDGYRAVRGWEIRNWKPAPGTFPLQEVERCERCTGGDPCFDPSQFAHLAITYSGLIVNNRDDGDPLPLRWDEQQEYIEAKSDALHRRDVAECHGRLSEQGQEARAAGSDALRAGPLPDESEHT